VEKTKRWVVDTDGYTPEEIQRMKNLIFELGGSIYATIPTINGILLIVNPFNTQEFSKKWTENSNLCVPDIQKNNPTLLYYCDENK
jgi:hypothetical protein